MGVGHSKSIRGQTPSIPRKGTETYFPCSFRFTRYQVRHPQFPARGRKLSERLKGGRRRFCQTPSIPRKGTETSHPRPASIDGCKCQTPSIPRKGTETLDKDLATQATAPSDTLNSPQGDGNRKIPSILPGNIMSDTLNSPQGDGNFGST